DEEMVAPGRDRPAVCGGAGCAGRVRRPAIGGSQDAAGRRRPGTRAGVPHRCAGARTRQVPLRFARLRRLPRSQRSRAALCRRRRQPAHQGAQHHRRPRRRGRLLPAGGLGACHPPWRGARRPAPDGDAQRGLQPVHRRRPGVAGGLRAVAAAGAWRAGRGPASGSGAGAVRVRRHPGRCRQDRPPDAAPATGAGRREPAAWRLRRKHVHRLPRPATGRRQDPGRTAGLAGRNEPHARPRIGFGRIPNRRVPEGDVPERQASRRQRDQGHAVRVVAGDQRHRRPGAAPVPQEPQTPAARL
ncbi:MAG: Putative diheme cytochrome c-553, partial [uncultured Ramlibacter sp.]